VAPGPTGLAQVGFRLFQTECAMCAFVPDFEAGIMSTGPTRLRRRKTIWST
jgi:hypothetical protein